MASGSGFCVALRSMSRKGSKAADSMVTGSGFCSGERIEGKLEYHMVKVS